MHFEEASTFLGDEFKYHSNAASTGTPSDMHFHVLQCHRVRLLHSKLNLCAFEMLRCVL